MAEFNPYVQITPTQTVVDPFNAMVPQRAAGVSRPAEDWGKILGNLAPVLTKHFARLEDDEREEQDLKAKKILAEEESSAVAEKIHRAAIAGNIPEGYSPYIVEQLNIQMARKAFIDYQVRADQGLAQFDDPDNTESPMAAIESLQKSILYDLPGVEDNMDFAKTWGPLVEKHKAAWMEGAHRKRSDARLRKVVSNAADDATNVIQRSTEGSDTLQSAKDLNAGLNNLINELRRTGAHKAMDGSGKTFIDGGKINQFVLMRLKTEFDALIKEEEFGLAERLLQAAWVLDPKAGKLNTGGSSDVGDLMPDKGKKGSFAYDFADKLNSMEATLDSGQRVVDRRRGDRHRGRLSTQAQDLSQAANNGEWREWLRTNPDANGGQIYAAAREHLVAGGKFGMDIELVPGVLGPAATRMVDAARAARAQNISAVTQDAQEAENKHKAQSWATLTADAVDQAGRSGGVVTMRTTLADELNKLKTMDPLLAETHQIKEETIRMRQYIDGIEDSRRRAAIVVQNDRADKSLTARTTLNETAREEFALLDPLFGITGGNRPDLPEAVEEFIDGLETRYAAHLVTGHEAGIKNATSNDEDAIRAAINAEWDKSNILDKLKKELVHYTEGHKRLMADEKQETLGKLSSVGLLPNASNIVGFFPEILTGFAASDARGGINLALDSRTKEGVFLLPLWSGDDYKEVTPYRMLFTDVIREALEAGSTEGFRGVYVNEASGRLIYSERLVDKKWWNFFKDDYSQEIANNIQITVDQTRAVDGFWADRKWTYDPNRKIYLDADTKLAIEPDYLNPNYFPVVSRHDIRRRPEAGGTVYTRYPTTVENDAFKAEWEAIEPNDWEAQNEVLDKWIEESKWGKVYGLLPMEYQGDPLEFIEDQQRLYESWYPNRMNTNFDLGYDEDELDETGIRKKTSPAAAPAGSAGAVTSAESPSEVASDLPSAEKTIDRMPQGRGATLNPREPIAHVENADGTISTQRTISFRVKGTGEVLVPTVLEDGTIMSDEEAKQRYRDTGESYGIFSHKKHATHYAKAMSTYQAHLLAGNEKE